MRLLNGTYPSQTDNPANSESGLFKALTRLFSGPIVSYRSQSGPSHPTSTSGSILVHALSPPRDKQFKKTLYSPLDAYCCLTPSLINGAPSVMWILIKWEYMPEIASTLDIYADEMTTYSELRPMLKC